MMIIPAIDIRNNHAVRLKQGDYKQETIYSASPLSVARAFEVQGAKRLHIVDLDGAKAAKPKNKNTILAIAKRTDMTIELGGGIRTYETAKMYLDNGIDYIIVGSMAIENPEILQTLLQQYQKRIIVGIDANNGYVATNGWLNTTQVDSVTFIKKLIDMGVSTVIYTDIAKDGMMNGPNVTMYKELATIPNINIIASGGVSTPTDILTLRQLNLYGAIIGRAIYEGTIRLSKVII